jgi:hypothetical protein
LFGAIIGNLDRQIDGHTQCYTQYIDEREKAMSKRITNDVLPDKSPHRLSRNAENAGSADNAGRRSPSQQALKARFNIRRGKT